MTLMRVEHNKKNPYIVINKSIVTDKRLSWKAKGIWMYAFSRPEDWQFYLCDLIKQSTDGRESIRSGLKELENAGYLHRSQKRTNGHFGSAEWVFYEESVELKNKVPQTGFPTTVDESTGNRPLLSNEVNQVIKKTTNETAIKSESVEPVKTPAAPSSFSSHLCSYGLSAIQIALCEEKYSSQEIERAIKCVDRAKNVHSKAALLLSALEEGYEPPKSKEERREENRAYFEKIKTMEGQKVGDSRYVAEAGPDYFMFKGTKFDGSDNHIFNIDSISFKQDILNFIAKLKE